jgi:hypothetical protein
MVLCSAHWEAQTGRHERRRLRLYPIRLFVKALPLRMTALAQDAAGAWRNSNASVLAEGPAAGARPDHPQTSAERPALDRSHPQRSADLSFRLPPAEVKIVRGVRSIEIAGSA